MYIFKLPEILMLTSMFFFVLCIIGHGQQFQFSRCKFHLSSLCY